MADLPNFLRQLSSDEYSPLPLHEADRAAIAATQEALGERPRSRRAGTAAGLLALNAQWGHTFFCVPPEAVRDEEAAAAAFAARSPVIDVQTHFLAPHALAAGSFAPLHDAYRTVMPDWWTGLEGMTGYSLAEYIRAVFLETDNAAVILTSGPGLDERRHLFNDEIAATRALVDEVAGPGRLLNHAVVHADCPREVEAMEWWRDAYRPVGWKVYTPGRVVDTPGGIAFEHGWMLDDERFGLPFLERARALGVPLICAHKGISGMVDNGSPRDIGPAARAFPDLAFVVYHSGYEMPLGVEAAEGPFTEETAHLGINRLIASARGAGLAAGSNVYPELGTTWFSLIRRPIEAAHVLGKLIAHFGEDNVIWGSDSAWYGPAQPLIDAFRSFQIPDAMCERYGYAPLTDAVRAKILGGNAARLYGIDLPAMAAAAGRDRLDWARALLADRTAERRAHLR